MNGPGQAVLVYQMGKVGSTTVYETLRGCEELRIPIHHVHCLSPLGLRKMTSHTPDDSGREHVEACLSLKAQIDRDYFSTCWKIVTLVREPVDLHVAAFLEGLDGRHPGMRRRDGTYDLDEVTALLQDAYIDGGLYPADWFTEWFERELQCVFGIDVYAYPFDPQAGYRLIRRNNVDVAVVRLENLDTCLPVVVDQLLGVRCTAIRPANTAAGKGQAELKTHIRRSLRVSPERCRAFFGTRMARHFYSEAEIGEFVKRWSGA